MANNNSKQIIDVMYDRLCEFTVDQLHNALLHFDGTIIPEGTTVWVSQGYQVIAKPSYKNSVFKPLTRDEW